MSSSNNQRDAETDSADAAPGGAIADAETSGDGRKPTSSAGSAAKHSSELSAEKPDSAGGLRDSVTQQEGHVGQGKVGGRCGVGGWGRAWVVLFVAVLFALVSDLWSKHLAFAHVAGDRGPVLVDRSHVLEIKREDARAINVLVPIHEPVTIVPSVLEFKLVLNPGAVFGVGPGQRWFFVGFTGVALGFALWMFRAWTSPRDKIVHIALGLVIGGGIGNLYDRLVHACVRDFIHPLPGVQWPFGLRVMGSRELWPYVSNLADLYLLVGIGVVVLHLWRRDAEPKSPGLQQSGG